VEVQKAAVAAVVRPSRTASERREEKRNKPVTENKPETDSEHSSPAIKVVMQIENGRVLKASVANHKPGMDSYEALALRIARQRRYPTTASGGETVTINVK
jgi:hypothetical protein